ncbi:MAG: chemotaxis protein CheA [Spirochaetaceae bacterium]|nr:chemotaxis protein CheA [Spirochaetaceae bacterium]
MSDYLDANNEELLKDFFSEAEQQVENLESNILVIENDPTNHEAIDEIFRAAHTLKGGSATVEMNELSAFTHAVEDLLDEIRSDKVSVTEDVVDVLLSSIDIIKAMLEARSNGSVYEDDVEPVKAKLKSFIPAKSGDKKTQKKGGLMAAVASASETKKAPAPAAPEAPAELSEYELLELKQICPSGTKLWSITVVFDETNPMNSVGGIQVFAALKEHGSILKTVPDFDALYEDIFHETVVYYLATAENADQLEDASFLTDVTISTDAKCLDQVEVASASATKPAAVQSAASAASAAPAAENKDEHAESEIEAAVSAAKKATTQTAKKPAAAAHSNAGGSVLRVDSKRIDYLMNLVSETVITKAAFNQAAIHVGELQTQLQNIEGEYKEKIRRLIEQLPKMIDSVQNGTTVKELKAKINSEYGDLTSLFDGFDASFKSTANKFRSSTQSLGRVAGELQEGVMKIRMVPISQIFSRFPRVVRDLSRDLDKKINLVIEGEETELDKSVIEDLLDPIMHCMRNSLDHGIEKPRDRLAAGKPEEGTVMLKASNEGNMIVIEIIDDGAGIDVAKVRNKAVERGLIHPNKMITDHDAFQLIFEPGFSTADKITSVSGRGVGLDVVKTQIEKLNGSVVVTSEKGKGTKFCIRLPLTVAIIQGLLVKVASEVYSIPIASVIESHRVRSDEISTIDNYEVLNVRNEVISVLRLDRLFGLKNEEESEYSFIVIVGSTDKKIGVMVDSLIGEEDVVIKPLHDQFTNSPGIAGASILGDGSVSLIIDVTRLLELGVKQELVARQEREAVVG